MSDQSKPHIPEPESGVLVHAEEQAPSAEEAALAEALARALDAAPPRGGGDAPDESLGGLLETATLVKASKHFELSPARKERVRKELDGFVDARGRKKARSPARSAWSFGLPLLAAGLAGALFVMRSAQQKSAPAEIAVAPQAAAALTERAEASAEKPRGDAEAAPHPHAALLKAQAEALARATSANRDTPGPARATLDRELEAYRSTLIASLDERLR